MNRRLYLLAIYAAAHVFLFACSKDDNPEPPVEQVIPLQVGNRWQYRVYLYERNGTMYDSSGIYTRTVLRDTTINKSTWYILNDRTIVRNTSRGYAYYNVAGNLDVLLYPSATSGNIGYNYVYPTYTLWVLTTPDAELKPIPDSRQKLTGRQYKLEYQYNYTSPASLQIQRRQEWVVPAVGMARADLFYRDTDLLQRRLELETYTLK
ncbi:hypothetical protein [Hymenobacter mucosus]|uniref:DUF4595 domain-containing protein n=1 Tax=Hymenobacter mucosus TaxID=1411120 RepID=A0A238WCY3_9BACT|nr:hypothetical protein [Hymenobacter mucosus]SNR44277.1 hypothetical protein SAMN06269173_102473 [Hymenobacter mucosus]